MLSKNFSGKKVTVLGAARSGVAVSKLLQKLGAEVFVSDSNVEEKLQESKNIFIKKNINFEFGVHSDKIFESSLFVISPGIPTNAPVIKKAIEKGKQVVSEIEFASWFCNSPITAITGSAGKTTTTTLLGRMVSDAKKKHFVAGNIGTPLSSFVLENDNETFGILEVSSFQLDFCFDFHPNISVLMNITQNHLDRYENKIENYAKSKSKIFENQNENDFLIYNKDDYWTNEVVKNRINRSVKLIPFSQKEILSYGAYLNNSEITLNLNGKIERVINLNEISLQGKHNFYNAMASTIAAKLMNVSTSSIRSTLKNFKGVEHRQEFVIEKNGILFINDSKSTTTESVKYAIEAYKKPIVLILGGKDKGNDYSEINELVKEKVKLIIAIGISSDKIINHFKNFVKVIKIETTNSEIPNRVDLEQTIKIAIDNSVSGDVVLFSPACASFDWFNNYEERGNIFKEIVLVNEK